MIKQHHILIGAFVIGMAVIGISFIDLQNSSEKPKGKTEGYLALIAKERQAKDAFMRESQQSPLTEEQKRSFHGLSYYPANEAYKVTASFERLANGEFYTLQTSKKGTQSYEKLGWVHFSINGKRQKALLLKVAPPGKEAEAFLPFLDETSGIETYGSGRYLDLPLPTGDKVEIDFNLAYYPYCAYSPDYDCPMPPTENHLEIPIPAGENGEFDPNHIH